MDESVFRSNKSDRFTGWVVVERPYHSAKFWSRRILVELHAAVGDHQETFSGTIKTWRCRVGEIRKLFDCEFGAGVVPPIETLAILACGDPQNDSVFTRVMEQH